MSTRNRGQRCGHRVERIERAVAEIFNSALLPSLEDPLLADLHVINVEAASNLARVTITVAPAISVETNADEVRAALQRAEGYLRQELADALRMKRVPALHLCYLPWPVSGAPEGGGA
ncbi:MAG TPA: ribosome-binding factor A [Planctomycetota bacterium]|nr:ribosome-binding factor A [Planctomycetota bacterium]